MPSLHRIPSLECADSSLLPLESPSKRELARHHSLPALSFSKPKGLCPSPLPTSRFCKSSHGRRSSPRPLYCVHRSVIPPHQLASFQSIPAWFLDNELDVTATWPPMDESLGLHDSVVYRDLSESVHCLEAPSRCLQVVRCSEGAVQTGVDIPQGKDDKFPEPSGIDVRGRPMSLLMLKRKASGKGGLSSDVKQLLPSELPMKDSMLHGVGGSVDSAFSSLVFMMESLQQYTIRLRRILSSEADVRFHVMMSKVNQEMQDTFLWLFQQVFACTPKLMLLTMMLLTDFAVHSMGDQVALGVMPMGEPPTHTVEKVSCATSLSDCLNVSDSGSMSMEVKAQKIAVKFSKESLVGPRLCAGGSGDKVAKALKVGGSMDREEAMPKNSWDRAGMTVEEDSCSGLSDAPYLGRYDRLEGDDVEEEQHKLSVMWQQAVSKESRRPLVQTGHMLIAPVQAPKLEADDYPCFDRTDLNYQHELGRDPSNPLLLANYAQFLHVVRHDHDRAEELYKRAVKADPVDGEVIGKYASFLWVAKEDEEAADEAFKAALVADPTNVYHAGSYANFLWNSTSDPEASAPITPSPYQQVSTS